MSKYFLVNVRVICDFQMSKNVFLSLISDFKGERVFFFFIFLLTYTDVTFIQRYYC